MPSSKKPTRRDFLKATSSAAIAAAATPALSVPADAAAPEKDAAPFTPAELFETRAPANLQRRQGYPGGDAHRRHRRGVHLHERLRRFAGFLDSHPAGKHRAARGVQRQLSRSRIRHSARQREPGHNEARGRAIPAVQDFRSGPAGPGLAPRRLRRLSAFPEMHVQGRVSVWRSRRSAIRRFRSKCA